MTVEFFSDLNNFSLLIGVKNKVLKNMNEHTRTDMPKKRLLPKLNNIDSFDMDSLKPILEEQSRDLYAMKESKYYFCEESQSEGKNIKKL